MEKRLKRVRIDILVVIILLLIGNISTFVDIINISTLIEEQGILNVLYSFVVPILIIGLLIYSYVKYKTDIKTASNAELLAVIIYFINATISFIVSLMGVLLIGEIFGFLLLAVIPLLLPFIIPTILLVDVVRIRKLVKSNERNINSESKNTTKATAVGSIIFGIVIVAVLVLSYFMLADTFKLYNDTDFDDNIGIDNIYNGIVNNNGISDYMLDSGE